jgi:hypothetical protein
MFILVSRTGGFLPNCTEAITAGGATTTKMARCATPFAAGIANTRKSGNNAARHFSLVLAQETFGTGH